MMSPYLHKVQYYETDKMGITHHSNYIRWMEESRVDFLEKIGWGFDRLEQEGIVSPVVGVQVRYRQSSTFADCVSIVVQVHKYNGILMELGYEMRNQKTGQVLCTAISEHCFLDQNGKPLRLKHRFPELDACMRHHVQEYQNTIKQA